MNCGHVTIGFLQSACWFVKYSVMTESKVTWHSFSKGSVQGGTDGDGCGSVFFCIDRQGAGLHLFSVFLKKKEFDNAIQQYRFTLMSQG